VERLSLDEPRRPDQIELRQINDMPLALSTERLAELLAEIKAGSRAPLQHVCLPTSEWAEVKRGYNDIAYYIKQAEAYFADIERQLEDQRKSQKPP